MIMFEFISCSKHGELFKKIFYKAFGKFSKTEFRKRKNLKSITVNLKRIKILKYVN